METKKYSNLIQCAWEKPSGDEYFTRENPATGEIVSTLPLSTSVDVDRAVASASDAFLKSDWSTRKPVDRSKVLLKIAQIIRENANSVSAMFTLENGRPLKFSKGEVSRSAEIFEYFAGLGRQVRGESFQNSDEIHSFTNKEPVGVCALITPWNFPIALLTWKLAPALAVGCTVVIKPSKFTTGTTLDFLGTWASSIPELPSGVVNCVSGPGTSVGMALVNHPMVSKISFTGETKTGKTIMQNAASGLKKVSLELGGKCALVVFDDASMEKVLSQSVWGAFRNSGQMCTAASRLLVQEGIYDKFVSAFAQKTKQLVIGNGMNENAQIGPLISQDQIDRVLDYVAIGTDEGANLLYGGKRLAGDDYNQGYFMQPTIFTDSDPSMKVSTEEIFGPVTSIMKFRDDKEALNIINSTEYGLAAGIWTNNLRRVFTLSRRILAGTIWVNGYLDTYPEMPFGGYRHSGIGRELGREGLNEYLNVKHVNFDLRTEPVTR